MLRGAALYPSLRIHEYGWRILELDSSCCIIILLLLCHKLLHQLISLEGDSNEI